jgi:hypothetical protein
MYEVTHKDKNCNWERQFNVHNNQKGGKESALIRTACQERTPELGDPLSQNENPLINDSLSHCQQKEKKKGNDSAATALREAVIPPTALVAADAFPLGQ